MNKRKILKRLIIAAVCVVCAVVVFEIVVRVMMDSEMRSRDDWNVQVGEHQYTSEERAVSVYDASVESTISVSRIVPDEYEEDGFTYYDEDVQQRLGQQLMEMVGQGASMDAPLAVLDPFGTGSNGLLLSFQTEAYTDSAGLTIDPAPDTLIRVFLAWKGLDAPVEVEPQTLTAPERADFTAVEWGGAEVD